MDNHEGTPYGLKMNKCYGDESKFHIWQKRFQYYSRVKIFAVGLDTQVNMSMSDAAYKLLLGLDDPEESQRIRIKSGRENEVALAQLNM